MKKLVSLLFFALVISAIAFAGGQQEGSGAGDASEGEGLSGEYAFGGSTTVQKIIAPAIEMFEEKHPNVTISYQGVGSSNGVKGVLDGSYSLGAASRELKASEEEKGVVSKPVASDVIAAVVNEDSVPIANLTNKEIAAIFAGEITNWSEVGGPDAEIAVFNRDEASGTREVFSEKCVASGGYESFTDDATIVTSNGDMAAKVGNTPNAIGYVGLGYADNEGLKTLQVGGVEASAKTAASGSYPYFRYLNVVYTGELSGVPKAFVDYLLSSEGQAIAEEQGFFALK
jgi:phosphate transport system substrate-binding protein